MRSVLQFGWSRADEGIGKTVSQISTDLNPSVYIIAGVVKKRHFVGILGGLKPSMFVLRLAVAMTCA